MNINEKMIAANIRNWLANMAIGAKAMSQEMICSEKEPDWKYTARCFDNMIRDDNIYVNLHNVKAVAKAADLELKHRDFVPNDFYFSHFTGEDFIVFNGVIFSDLISRTVE